MSEFKQTDRTKCSHYNNDAGCNLRVVEYTTDSGCVARITPWCMPLGVCAYHTPSGRYNLTTELL